MPHDPAVMSRSQPVTPHDPAVMSRALAVVPHARPLVPGTLVRRYKRFFADVRLESGRVVVTHCVNPGRMEGLLRPGLPVWVSRVPRQSARKLRWTWELADDDGVLVGTNTILPNRIVKQLLLQRVLPGLSGWKEIASERAYGNASRSRVDFWLRLPGGEVFLEVKNCHLVYPDRRAYFPDAPSERAARHLDELAAVARAGHRALVLFTVQRADARALRPSDLHDPRFAAAARRAAAAGVRFRALSIRPTLAGFHVERFIPVDLTPYSTRRIARWRDENA